MSTALAGGAVAFAGGISFVGLLAPHIARKLVGSAFGALLPASALIGGIIVLLADTVGRTVFLPLDIPAGVFTAAIGDHTLSLTGVRLLPVFIMRAG